MSSSSAIRISIHVVSAVLLVTALYVTWSFRTRAVPLLGTTLRISDPWFNYRATEYLSDHGWTAFFRWFDDMSWYPIGRPVGTSIYPGLQLTSVAIHRVLNNYLGISMSLNDVCFYLPVCFAIPAVLQVAALTYLWTGAPLASSFASFFFALIPIHIIRTMGGEYDVDSIFLAPMLFTFLCYLMGQKGGKVSSVVWGVMAGFSYGYTASLWQGHVFIINMIALHAGAVVFMNWLRGVFNTSLFRTYLLLFTIGTFLATCVPVVGLSPLTSMEQVSGVVVLVIQGLLFILSAKAPRLEIVRDGPGDLVLGDVSEEAAQQSRQKVTKRLGAVMMINVTVVSVTLLLWKMGLLSSPSSRVAKILYLSYTPRDTLETFLLSLEAGGFELMWELLQICQLLWIGGVAVEMFGLRDPVKVANVTAAHGFFVLYAWVGVFFTLRNVRCVFFSAPIAAMFSGSVINYCSLQVLKAFSEMETNEPKDPKSTQQPLVEKKDEGKKKVEEDKEKTAPSLQDMWLKVQKERPTLAMLARFIPMVVVMLLILFSNFGGAANFIADRWASMGLQEAVEGKDGKVEIRSDSLEGLYWLRDHTPTNARVLSMFDYGFHINGIANRTTLFDSSHGNFPHTALVSRIWVSPLPEAHAILRHLADYVYVFQGTDQRSDVYTAPFLASLAHHQFGDLCVADPRCSQFGFSREEEGEEGQYTPKPSLEASLLYQLTPLRRNDRPASEAAPHNPKKRKRRGANPTAPESNTTKDESSESDESGVGRYFEKVFETQHGEYAIYKVMNVSEESREWIADPRNHDCEDAPHEWICRGRYPPAKEVQDILTKRFDESSYTGKIYEELEDLEEL